jgi:TonB family protein
MKTILFFAISMLITTFAFGQEPQEVAEIQVTAPQFTGVENATLSQTESANLLIRNYLKDRINYPEKAQACNIDGTEVVQFTVTADGNLADFKIINSVCTEIDQEIVGVLKNTNGMWLPGYNNGKPVDMTKEVSMVFCLDNGSSKSTHEIFTEKATHYFNSGNKNLFEKHNPKKALKFYSWGVNYLPYDHSLLLWRGMCRYELGDKEGAMDDWNRMTSLGCDIDMSEYITQIADLKGYNELIAILKK